MNPSPLVQTLFVRETEKLSNVPLRWRERLAVADTLVAGLGV